MPVALAPPAVANPADAANRRIRPRWTIVWHLLADPARRYRDLGPELTAPSTTHEYETLRARFQQMAFDNRIRPECRKINHIRQLEALGYTVTLTPAA